MPYGWEGNRRPGVALAGMEFGSEHPAYTPRRPHEVRHTSPVSHC